MSKTSENKTTERIDIESIEARMRLWAIGDVSDEDLALELDYIVPELKRCYEKLDVAESALTEIWAYQIDNVGGYNVTEILLYYEKAHGLNIRPDASE